MGDGAVFRKIVWMVVVVFALTGTVQAYEVARVMTTGKLNVYRDGKLVQVLRENAPLPEGALLKAEGNCGVQLDNMYLVAEDGSQFSVQNGSGGPLQLDIRSGTVYFAVNQMTVDVLFQTPGGQVDTREFGVKPETDGVMKGFVNVNGGITTIGVLEGGNLVVSTPEGTQTITPGSQITLAQAQNGAAPAAAPASTAAPAEESAAGGGIERKYLIGGGLALLGIGVAGLALGGSSGGGSPAPASPAAP